MTLLIDDKTPEGKHVRVEETRFGFAITVDGQAAEVMTVSTERDGGTRVIITDRGTITLPHKLNSADRVPKLDGADIGPVPPEVLAERQAQEEAFDALVRAESAARLEDGGAL